MAQVLSDRSLEWASWLLRFLLKDVGAEDATVLQSEGTAHALVRSPSLLSADITGGMVHNAVVADAIVRYLRTPSVPFKPRAVALLAHLLKAPQLFPLDKLPDMATIHSVCSLVLNRCTADRTSSKQLFLPEGLLLYVELSVTAAAAQRVFDMRISLHEQRVAEESGLAVSVPRSIVPTKLTKTYSGIEPRSEPIRHGLGTGFAFVRVDADVSGPLSPPFEVSLPGPYMPALVPTPTVSVAAPPKLAVESASSLLGDVSDLVHCLGRNSRIPDRILCRAWLDSIGVADFAESAHPVFPSDASATGTVLF